MERPPDERVTRSIAREIARREQLKALVAGSIGSLGSHYVLALEAINAETGDVMAREQVEVAGQGAGADVARRRDVAAAREARRVAGVDSAVRRPAAAGDDPVARGAACLLARARSKAGSIPRVEAIPHLKRAIELDPNFAMAQALLSGVYANTGQSAEAPGVLAEGVRAAGPSERARAVLHLVALLHRRRAGLGQGAGAGLSWTATYPREAFAFNSLGLASGAFGQHEQAVERLPRSHPPRPQVRSASRKPRRIADRAQPVRRGEGAARRGDGSAGSTSSASGGRRTCWPFSTNDAAAMARELTLARTTPEAMWASNWEARTSAFSGRLRAAHELFQRGVQAARREQLPRARRAVDDGGRRTRTRSPGSATRRAARSRRGSSSAATTSRSSAPAARWPCAVPAARPSSLSDELAARFPDATLTTRIQLPVTAAALALQRGEPARALELLEPVKPYDHAPAAEFWPAYLRGQAYLQLKDGRAAARPVPEHPRPSRRGARPRRSTRSRTSASLARPRWRETSAGPATAYEGFFALWNGADPDLQPLNEGRERVRPTPVVSLVDTVVNVVATPAREGRVSRRARPAGRRPRRLPGGGVRRRRRPAARGRVAAGISRRAGRRSTPARGHDRAPSSRRARCSPAAIG